MPAETHSHHGPLDRDDVARLVCEQLAEILGVDPDAITLDTRLREDLDADDFALIDLAEAVEAELGERIGRSVDRRRRSRRAARPSATRSTASSLACVGARQRAAARAASSPEALDRARGDARRRSSRTRRCCMRSLAHRSWCAENGEAGVERTARVPRRLRARPRRHALRVRALPAPARRAALRSARRRRERARARRGRATSSTSARTCCSARAKTPPAAARSSRSSPTRSKRSSPPCTSTPGSRPRAISCCVASRTASPKPPPAPAAATTRPASRSSPRRAPLGRPRYLVRDEGPDHAKHFFATVLVERPAVRRGRRSLEEAGRAGGGLGRVESAAAKRGATMPELPEVEVLRRDLEKEVVGKKIKTVEVDGAAVDPPPQAEEGLHRRARRPQDRVGRSGGASTS